MNTYPKIPSPFKRFTEGPNKGKLDPSRWVSQEVELLADAEWTWTEKLDGTNVRVIWDGYRVEYRGRTDRAEMPAELMKWLEENLPEEMLEQTFGEGSAVLFGEGIGPKIQNGGNYGETRMVLFDVWRGAWLRRESLGDISSGLGMELAPEMRKGESLLSVVDGFDGFISELNPEYGLAEGVVGTAPLGMLDRMGRRIQVKVKVKDFRGIDLDG